MKYLNYNDIIREAIACPNGRFIRVGYSKELKMNKDWEALGYRAYKFTETTVRLGVNYGNIATVKARKEAEAEAGVVKKPRANNYTWVVPHKVKYNSKTGKTYLQVASCNGGHNTKNKFLVYDGYNHTWHTFDKTEWELSEFYMMVDAKSREKSSNKPEVFTITFDNIYKLGSARA